MKNLSRSFAITCICLFLLSCGSQTTTSLPSSFVDGVTTALENGGDVDLTAFEWTREPAAFSIDGQTLTVTTAPHTDLWQRTYYHFRNDNAPVFQVQTKEQYFSFVVKTDFTQSHQRFDQCGIVMYLDSDNWLKGSVEFENDAFQHLGSVATNNGYSDWATTAIPADVKTMWYRFSRRHRVFDRRDQLQPDAHMPHVCGCRCHPLRRIRLFPGRILLHSRFLGHEDYRVPVESPRRPAAGSGIK